MELIYFFLKEMPRFFKAQTPPQEEIKSPVTKNIFVDMPVPDPTIKSETTATPAVENPYDFVLDLYPQLEFIETQLLPERYQLADLVHNRKAESNRTQILGKIPSNLRPSIKLQLFNSKIYNLKTTGEFLEKIIKIHDIFSTEYIDNIKTQKLSDAFGNLQDDDAKLLNAVKDLYLNINRTATRLLAEAQITFNFLEKKDETESNLLIFQEIAESFGHIAEYIFTEPDENFSKKTRENFQQSLQEYSGAKDRFPEQFKKLYNYITHPDIKPEDIYPLLICIRNLLTFKLENIQTKKQSHKVYLSTDHLKQAIETALKPFKNREELIDEAVLGACYTMLRVINKLVCLPPLNADNITHFSKTSTFSRTQKFENLLAKALLSSRERKKEWRIKELEAENDRLRKMYIEEKLKAEIASEALQKKF